MNNLAFQIYGTKKAAPFQSVWKTDTTSTGGGDQAARGASAPVPSDWALGPGGGTTLNNAGYTHNASGSNPLLFGMAMTAGQSWQIICTFSAGSTGEVIINFGDAPSVTVSTNNLSTTINLTTTTTLPANFRITPVGFVGNVKLSILQSSSAANQIQLPITSIPVGKSIWIDWGDNQYSTMNSTNIVANRIHTYTTPGEYTVRILGDNFNFGFGNTNSVNDRLKIKSISSWGKLKISQASFNGCSNMTMSGITDVIDLTGVTSLSSAFLNCSKITTVGRMNEWNTSGVTIMGAVFNGCVLFNQCIGGWNVSNVTTFEGMFYNCWEFNNGDNSTPLNDWRFSTTSSVSLNYPFILCKKFNRYIGDWNTSNVTIMSGMFDSCIVFNNGFAPGVGTGNQLNWDTSSCTTMAGMFVSAPAFNSNISLFNVSKVTTFNKMFYGCNTFNNGFALGDGVGNQLPWNIGGNITGPINMDSMFSPAPAFNSNLGTGATPWDVSKVNNFTSMFNGASRFNNGNEDDITKSKINNWNIGGSVTSVSLNSMFASASVFNRDISSWNVSKATSTNSMFAYASAFNQPIGNWERSTPGNVSTMGNITNMGTMFQYSLAFNQDINLWNVNKVTSFYGMFQGARDFNKYIGDWNINTEAASVDMTAMFWVAPNFNQDISKWNVSKVTAFVKMFAGATAFNNGDNNQENPENPVPRPIGINGWNINTTATSVSMFDMFNGASAFNRLIDSWNVSKVTNMVSMFENARAFNQPLAGWERITPNVSSLSSVTTMSKMFHQAFLFNRPIGNWNVSNVTDMSNMFAGFFNVGFTTFNQDISNWNVSNVTTMNSMFTYNNAFNQTISGWNVPKVNNFGSMFTASRYNQPLNLLNIGGDASVTTINMSSMFLRNGYFNQDISMWNTSKVTNMSFMFYNDNAPVSTFNQPIGTWNVGNVTNMSAMFQGAFAFNESLENWDVSKVTNMSSMFASSTYSVTNFNQNIGSWNVFGVTNFTNFMTGKTPATFSSTNLDAIYNGWIVNGVQPNISSPLATNISFGSARYTANSSIKRGELEAAPNNWRIADGGITTIIT
jgi:surface protein